MMIVAESGNFPERSNSSLNSPVRISVWQAQMDDEMSFVSAGRQEDYLSACIHSSTIYRRSRNPRPSKIAGIAFSIRAARVPDCFAPAK